MCLTGGKIPVALVTTHIPLHEVPCALKQAEIVRVGELLAKFVQRRQANSTDGVGQARIAVCGLNPHAGESGKIGREEIEIIAPAVAELNSSLVTKTSPARTRSSPGFFGPVSPDTVFH